jgi:hypothetical protein
VRSGWSLLLERVRSSTSVDDRPVSVAFTYGVIGSGEDFADCGCTKDLEVAEAVQLEIGARTRKNFDFLSQSLRGRALLADHVWRDGELGALPVKRLLKGVSQRQWRCSHGHRVIDIGLGLVLSIEY